MSEPCPTVLLTATRTSFLHGLGASVFALVIAKLYFPVVFEMAASALIALSLYQRMESYLEYNRRAIWESKLSPWRVNTKLALEFFSLFAAIFLVSLVQQIAFETTSVTQEKLSSAFQNEFLPLLLHNGTILVTTFLFTVLYRAGGLIVVLSWNALHWSRTLFGYFDFMAESLGVISSLVVMSSIVPHLVTEVVAYVLAGMAGTFFGKGMSKYEIFSERFVRVARACIVLLLFAGALLFLANILEIFLAQTFWGRIRT